MLATRPWRSSLRFGWNQTGHVKQNSQNKLKLNWTVNKPNQLWTTEPCTGVCLLYLGYFREFASRTGADSFHERPFYNLIVCLGGTNTAHDAARAGGTHHNRQHLPRRQLSIGKLLCVNYAFRRTLRWYIIYSSGSVTSFWMSTSTDIAMSYVNASFG